MKFQITQKTPWTDASGQRFMQEEVAVCTATKVGDFVEYSVDEILSVKNQPEFYQPMVGGGISAAAFKEGKLGLIEIAFI